MLKKLFSLVSIMALAIFARAEIVQDAYVDFTTMESYNMWHGDAPEGGTLTLTADGLTIVNPATGIANWQFQYFVADGVNITKGVMYDIEVELTATGAGRGNFSFGGWGDGNAVDEGFVFSEGTNNIKCDAVSSYDGGAHLTMQTGSFVGTITVKNVKISHNTDAANTALYGLKLYNIEHKENAWDNSVDYAFPTALVKDKTYKMSIDYYGVDGEGNLTILPGGNWGQQLSANNIKKGKWNTATCEFTAQDNYSTITFMFGTENHFNGTAFWIDNFSITEVGSDVNLVGNNDFAAGNFDGWTKPGWHNFGMKVREAPAHPEPITVYYNNVVTNWEEVYVYMWDANNNDANNGAWPGNKMTKGEGTIWSYTFTNFEPTNVIFNNNAGQQTSNLVFEAGKTYGDTYVEFYLRGEMNGWGTTTKFETADNVNYTLTGVNIEAGKEFKIANSTWNIAYGYNEPIALGVEYILATDGGNMTLAEAMVNGSINFDYSTGKATFKQGVVTPAGNTITDVLNNDNTVQNTSNSYADYTDVTISSDAVYSLNAGGDKGSIQLRSKNNSGIVTTTSGGTLKNVTVTFNSGTSSTGNRTLEVYAKNEPYATPADLYSTETQGTKVASLTNTAAEGLTYSYAFEGEYQYIGLRSKDGAMYIDEIKIEWETAGAVVVAPTFTPAPGMVKSGTQVTMETQTEGAEIYYTTDETEPTVASTKYTAPVTIYDYTVFKAVAIANGESSKVVTAEYIVMPAIEDLSPITDFEDGTKFTVNCELTVVYANGANVYVYDGTYYGLLYKNNLGFAAGDVIAAGWDGSLKIYNGLYEIIPQTELTTNPEAQPKVANPIPVEAEDAEMTLAAYNMNRYFTLEGVVFDAATPATKANFTGKMGEFEVPFRNNFGIESVEAGTYNVTGFLGVYNENVQFYPINYALPPVVCDNIAELNAIEVVDNKVLVKLTLDNAKITFEDPWGAGTYFIEDATGATRFIPCEIDEWGYPSPVTVEGIEVGKAISGTFIGYYEGEQYFDALISGMDMTSSVDADVTVGTVMTLAEALQPENNYRLITFEASDEQPITAIENEGMMIGKEDNHLLALNQYYTFPEGYVFPASAEKITGILTMEYMKFLSLRTPDDIVAAENEDNVLWKSSNEEEESTADWRRVFTMTAEEAQEQIGIGDYLLVTVSYVNPEGGWPQVAVLPIEGWPPYTNEGVSKESECPFVVRFPIAGPLAKQMWENGFGVSGGDVRISKIVLEKATEELDPNTVWFGGKQCNWGNGIGLSKDIFANAKAGDKVVINYAPGEATLQIMPGGWSGPNFPIYANLPFFVRDEANNQMIFTLQSDFDALVYEDNTYDIFALLKSDGLMMHGPCYVNSILYVPAPETTEYTVYFDNSASQWEAVYAYVWNGEVNNAWPGELMTEGENDIWTITFTEFEPANIIFNNNDGTQTADLVFENGKTYVGEAPAPSTELYIRGSFNSWGQDLMFTTEDNVNYSLVYTAVIPAGSEFKIATADWKINYTYVEGTILPNVEYTFINGNDLGNATIAEEIAAGAKLTFNSETGAFKIEGSTGIYGIDSDVEAEYYNMQGVRLAHPTIGQPCIRVINGIATKVIIK